MVKQFDNIYKRTSTGAVQQWKQEINPENPAEYRTLSGQVDGKIVESEWKLAEATNVGKKNERTPDKQALFEIQANYKKRLDKDYHRFIENIDKAKIFKPMLAKEYENYKNKIKFPIYTQPKLDGMRCIITKEGMFSRNGKPIISCPHIFEALTNFFMLYPDIILDGELYNHDFSDNFDDLMSLCKKTKPTPEDLEKSKELIQFHMFDVTTAKDSALISVDWKERVGKNDTLMQRYDKFGYVLCKVQSEYSYMFVRVPTHTCFTHEEISQKFEEAMESGYEGLILRTESKYENKKCTNLLKYKEWVDSEFKLIRFEDGVGNWKDKAKRAIFELDDGSGREFKAGVKGSMKYCEQLYKEAHTYIGTMCTVIYAPQRTPDGIPRFGRVKEFDRRDNIDV